MKIKIKVANETITNGKRRSALDCAVAQAIKNSLAEKQPDVKGLRVDATTVTLYKERSEKVLELPSKAVEFIEKFDDEEIALEPIQFTLDVPDF